MTPNRALRARFFRRAAAFAAAAAMLLSLRAAPADTGSVRFIPSDCNLVVHVDLDRVAADSQMGAFLDQGSTNLRAQGLTSNLRDLSSLSVGLVFPPNFSVVGAMGGQIPEGFAVHIALTSKTPLDWMESALVMSGFAARDVNGRRLLFAPAGGITWSFSNDKKTALAAMSPASVEKMVAAYSGANATAIPGFGSGATAGTFLYIFGTGLDKLLSQVAPLAGLAIAGNATTPQQQQAAMKLQQEIGAVGKVQAFELSLALGGTTVDTLFRIATANAQDAASVANFIGVVWDLLKAQNPMTQGLPSVNIQPQGNMVSLSGSVEKQAFLIGLQQGMQQSQAAARGGY